MIVNVRVVPFLPSRISLRIRSVSEGNGPAVSVGVTARENEEEDEEPAAGPLVVVELGFVGLSAQPNATAAPAAPRMAAESLFREDCGCASECRQTNRHEPHFARCACAVR
jgi:hypothetical protein